MTWSDAQAFPFLLLLHHRSRRYHFLFSPSIPPSILEGWPWWEKHQDPLSSRCQVFGAPALWEGGLFPSSLSPSVPLPSLLSVCLTRCRSFELCCISFGMSAYLYMCLSTSQRIRLALASIHSSPPSPIFLSSNLSTSCLFLEIWAEEVTSLCLFSHTPTPLCLRVHPRPSRFTCN